MSIWTLPALISQERVLEGLRRICIPHRPENTGRLSAENAEVLRCTGDCGCSGKSTLLIVRHFPACVTSHAPLDHMLRNHSFGSKVSAELCQEIEIQRVFTWKVLRRLSGQMRRSRRACDLTHERACTNINTVFFATCSIT